MVDFTPDLLLVLCHAKTHRQKGSETLSILNLDRKVTQNACLYYFMNVSRRSSKV